MNSIITEWKPIREWKRKKLAVSYIENTVPYMGKENSYMGLLLAWLLLAGSHQKTLQSRWESNQGTSDQPTTTLGARPLSQCKECALLTSCGACEVAGGWHLKESWGIFKGTEWSDRYQEGNWKEEEREERLASASLLSCIFVKLGSTDTFIISKAESKIL